MVIAIAKKDYLYLKQSRVVNQRNVSWSIVKMPKKFQQRIFNKFANTYTLNE